MPQTVLIVNGDADTREILRVLLRHHGYQTREVETADAAIRAATADPPALITGEFWVAGESGPCCLPERMRADDATAAARILILTADAFEGLDQQARFAGADALMTKPFDLTTLLGEVRRLIGIGLGSGFPRYGADRGEEGQARA